MKRRETPEYNVWAAIRQWCANPRSPQYFRYGRRGIRVCDRWGDSFETFYADVGPRPSRWHRLRRLDERGPFSPENCQWWMWGPGDRGTFRGLPIVSFAGQPAVHWPGHELARGRARGGGYVTIARLLLWERLGGRSPGRSIRIHWRDGNKWNFSLDNLEIVRAGRPLR